MAWLNAVPQPDAKSRRGKNQAEPNKVSRAEQLKKDKIALPMPPNPAPHVIDRLVEIGLTEAAGMGSAPISWQSITAWQAATGVALPPWEARLLRKLSVEYLAESRRAESENCPPPWMWEVTPRERDIEEQRLRLLLG